jgi:hypothetical protein
MSDSESDEDFDHKAKAIINKEATDEEMYDYCPEMFAQENYVFLFDEQMNFRQMQ